MINKINDPLANISINRFIEGFKQYPELEKVFNIRLKRLISKGISFYELPRIYQWIIINKYLMPKKLNTINSCLNKLFNIDNNNLNKKINEFAKWLNHQQISINLLNF